MDWKEYWLWDPIVNINKKNCGSQSLPFWGRIIPANRKDIACRPQNGNALSGEDTYFFYYILIRIMLCVFAWLMAAFVGWSTLISILFSLSSVDQPGGQSFRSIFTRFSQYFLYYYAINRAEPSESMAGKEWSTATPDHESAHKIHYKIGEKVPADPWSAPLKAPKSHRKYHHTKSIWIWGP